MPTELRIIAPDNSTHVAMTLIDRFEEINNYEFNLNILFDYTLNDLGEFDPIQPDTIWINPSLCKTINESKSEMLDPFCTGYVRDFTTTGVILHEFCHYATYNCLSAMRIAYMFRFPTNRLCLSEYANNCVEDELAEAMVIYITNPYLLKLLAPDRWTFFKKHFKSPTPTSTLQCYKSYMKFPVGVKEELKERWGIAFSEIEMDFVRLKPTSTSHRPVMV